VEVEQVEVGHQPHLALDQAAVVVEEEKEPQEYLEHRI
jgi:hypothetical protein